MIARPTKGLPGHKWSVWRLWRPESERARGDEVHRGGAGRVGKAEPLRMEHQPVHRIPNLGRGIEIVAENRVTDRLQVQP